MSKDKDPGIVVFDEGTKVQKLSDILAKNNGSSLGAMGAVFASSIAKMFPLIPVIDTIKEEAKRVRHEMKKRGEDLAAAELKVLIEALEDPKLTFAVKNEE